ncbi:MAG: glycosyltransferase, partial [Chloroflexi bacterium]|nr:glycosyltransferase [Chloroflexota bacterium]
MPDDERVGKAAASALTSCDPADRGALVSVVVSGYTKQRLRDIEELLDSLQSQTFPNIETVFVGEGDPDLCPAVMAYAEAKGMKDVRTVFNDGVAGLSPARNLGAR